MLQTLNIPSSPLPEVPSAQPGAHGDAGERVEFAQLLQQAKAVEPERDAPTVLAAKHARTEPRARPGAAAPRPQRKRLPARRSADHRAGAL